MNNYNIVKIKSSKNKLANGTYIESFVILETEIFDWETGMGFAKKYIKTCETNEEINVVPNKMVELWKSKDIPYTILNIKKKC